MKDVLYLAFRYLRYNRVKTAVLVASISLILFLPTAMQVLVRQAARVLTARADATPLLIGARGSGVDLTLAALYFREPSLPPMPFREVERIEATGLAAAIPLNLRYAAGGQRLVGTTPEYFEFRGLRIARGRGLAILGECVLGARAAEALGAGPGDELLSAPAGAFDVGGSFPLKMKVVGVLAPAGTPDDQAVFADLKTAWVIAGIAHGHTDVTAPRRFERSARARRGQRGRERVRPSLHRHYLREHRLLRIRSWWIRRRDSPTGFSISRTPSPTATAPRASTATGRRRP